jgi:hypothetical protein
MDGKAKTGQFSQWNNTGFINYFDFHSSFHYTASLQKGASHTNQC